MKYLIRLALIAILILPCVREVGAMECAMFDEGQRNTLQNAYDYGKEHNVGWTMAAIAWQESSAGKRLVNWSDPSFGVYHVLLKNAASVEGVDIALEPFKGLTIAARLMYDHDYAASQSLAVIEFWRMVHGDDWHKVWASYNAGYGWSGAAGQAYAKSIANKIKYLKQHNCVVR